MLEGAALVAAKWSCQRSCMFRMDIDSFAHHEIVVMSDAGMKPLQYARRAGMGWIVARRSREEVGANRRIR